MTSRRTLTILVTAAVTLISTLATTRVARAQSEPTPVAPAARPADVASIDAIIKACYDVISGPAGPRDWDRFISLFAPDARLIPTRHDSTGIHIRTLSPQEYATRAGANFTKNAFFEKSIGNQVDQYGAIAQVFSAYASRRSPDDPKPFARGINSFQLFNDGHRWYIVTIYWDSEQSGETIPDRYLKQGQ
jgi:hypothetical protein